MTSLLEPWKRVVPHTSSTSACSSTVLPTLAIVAGVHVDGAPTYTTSQRVEYCAPVCGAPITETWRLGGAAYGIDLGLQLRLR